ncbi:MAG TPA: hypothetical protein VMA37_16840 [Acetobacteraceae bacterium]|nr:hypothetical protein [Acetobacteraceae bacterium]
MRFRAAFIAAMVVIGTIRFAEAKMAGVRDFAVFAPARNAVFHATVWYPAGGNGKAVLVGDNAIFIGTKGLRNAPIAAGRFPLIIISHGGFRAAPNIASWLASALAGKGYIAAVVIPPAVPPGPPKQSVLNELWLRPADLSAILSAVEKQPTFFGKIDTNEIGAVGFFLGGYAVLELAGARVDAKVFAQSCEGGQIGPDCAWFAQGGVDLRRVDAARLERSNLDWRFKAAVVIDPELTSALTRRSLQAVSIPIHVVNLGQQDAIPAAFDASRLASEIPGATYATIPKAGPFSSFPECKPNALSFLKGEGEGALLCSDSSGRSRPDIHSALASMIEADLEQSFSTKK